MIDGIRWNASETRVDQGILVAGKPIPVACKVAKQDVRIDVDGRTMIDWNGDLDRLSFAADWAPVDGRKLFFGSTAHFKLTDIRLGPP